MVREVACVIRPTEQPRVVIAFLAMPRSFPVTLGTTQLGDGAIPVPVIAFPLSSVTTQRVREPQETPYKKSFATFLALHAAAPPFGLVETSTLPNTSVATH